MENTFAIKIKFVTEDGRKTLMTIPDADMNAEEADVKALVDYAIANSVFEYKGSKIVNVEDAYLVETKKTVYESVASIDE